MFLQVPVPVSDNRAQFMAMKWIILAAKDKDPKVHFPEKLAWELVDAAANRVSSRCQLSCIFQDIKKKKNSHIKFIKMLRKECNYLYQNSKCRYICIFILPASKIHSRTLPETCLTDFLYGFASPSGNCWHVAL
jgi:hypothetical protein